MLNKETQDDTTRLSELVKKVDDHIEVSQKQAADTSELLEMWRDASVVFKWLRKIGSGFVWISQVVVAIGALYGIGQWWGNRT